MDPGFAILVKLMEAQEHHRRARLALSEATEAYMDLWVDEARVQDSTASSVSDDKLKHGLPCAGPLTGECATHQVVVPDAEAKDEPPGHAL